MVSLAGSENVETMEMHLQHAQNTMEFAKLASQVPGGLSTGLSDLMDAMLEAL